MVVPVEVSQELDGWIEDGWGDKQASEKLSANADDEA